MIKTVIRGRWLQVVLPHIKGTMEALHVGEVMTAMPLAKHLPAGLVDDDTANRLKAFILCFFEVWPFNQYELRPCS